MEPSVIVRSMPPMQRCCRKSRCRGASASATVKLASGTAVIASDNMYLYENLEKHLPIAQTLDAASNLRAQERMTTLATEPRLIVPGHDPAVFNRFPSAGN